MSAKRTVGLALAIIGLIAIVTGSLMAGAAEPAPHAGADQLASAPTAVGLGWLLGGLGVVLSFLGLLFVTNARRAFY